MRFFLSSPSLRLLSALRVLTLRPISTAPTHTPLQIQPDPPNPRSRTPLEKQFESWIHNLKPGFTHSDVNLALTSQSDPDLSLDIFHWTAQQRHYKHDHTTYLTMISIAVDSKRFGVAETLIEQVIAGACTANITLFNTMISFCCNRKLLFNRAFDIYKKMLKFEDVNAKPDLETYKMLFSLLLRKFGKLNVCYVYLPAVRSLAKQMKAAGVIPDVIVLNMIIKAYSKSRDVEDAIRVFREMKLYNCEPNEFTYSYIVQGLCEKGRVSDGFVFFKEMIEKKLVPRVTAYLILICSLALERRFDEGIDVVYDMLGNSMSPDFLTYQTLLGEMCRDRRGDDAFEFLEECRKRDTFMNEHTYTKLLNGLHFMRRDL